MLLNTPSGHDRKCVLWLLHHDVFKSVHMHIVDFCRSSLPLQMWLCIYLYEVHHHVIDYIRYISPLESNEAELFAKKFSTFWQSLLGSPSSSDYLATVGYRTYVLSCCCLFLSFWVFNDVCTVPGTRNMEYKSESFSRTFLLSTFYVLWHNVQWTYVEHS